MKLSTRAEYGTRALLELALCRGEGPIRLEDIARRQQFSKAYLAHLIAPLRAAGLVTSSRGRGGGLSLLKPPEEIRLSEVFQILEGSSAPVECVDRPSTCPRAHVCATRDIWAEMKKALDGVLESTTLQDLVERQRQKQQQATAMYHI